MKLKFKKLDRYLFVDSEFLTKFRKLVTDIVVDDDTDSGHYDHKLDILLLEHLLVEVKEVLCEFLIILLILEQSFKDLRKSFFCYYHLLEV